MGFLALHLSRAQRADFIAKGIPVTRRIKFHSSISQRSSARSTQLHSHIVLLSCSPPPLVTWFVSFLSREVSNVRGAYPAALPCIPEEASCPCPTLLFSQPHKSLSQHCCYDQSCQWTCYSHSHGLCASHGVLWL